jgi:hypothetical protein
MAIWSVNASGKPTKEATIATVAINTKRVAIAEDQKPNLLTNLFKGILFLTGLFWAMVAHGKLII